MLNIKSISETLAALGGAALIVGCGGAAKDSVNASEVTAEPAKTADAPTEAATAGDAASGATDAPATDPKAPETAGAASGPVAPRAGATPVPTVEEWNAQTKEVTIKGSSTLGCETKMVREYVRISCRGKNDTGGTPVSVVSRKGAPEAYFFANGGVVSAVFPYVQGTDATLAFTWTDKTHPLQLSWPRGAPQPPQLGLFADAEKPAPAKTGAATPAKPGATTAKPAGKDGKKPGATGSCGEGTCG